MGLFDIFKRNKAQETIPKPDSTKAEIDTAIAPVQPKEEVAAVAQAYDEGLTKTKENFFTKIGKAIIGKSSVDADFLDELEDALVAADLGATTTVKIIERLEARVARDKYINTSELNRILREEIIAMLDENNQQKLPDFSVPKNGEPYVIMVVGVNGVGKTTTIGKLAYQFKNNGNDVILGAADTFRAAAVDQLTIWSERVGVDIVSRGMGADPASVAFDAVQSGKARNADVIIVYTAGRLHNKVGLMNELSKIKNVMKKAIPDAPHEILLVLDASTGQNAIEQARQFLAATDVNALALTKLDGTAKGGVVIAIADQLQIPIKYIGVGEKITDLKPFDKVQFINSLLPD